MRQVKPVAQVASLVHCDRQVASMQSEPAEQSPAVLHMPVGRPRQSPAWHDWPVLQSLSTVQPK